jgi:hypothetical protein
VGTGRWCFGFAATTDTRATDVLRCATTVGAATKTLGAETLGVERCGFEACLAGGGGSGAACTVVREAPAESGGDCGVVSGPSVTTAGSVIAAAMAVPATAAAAMIVSPLLINSPISADPVIMVSAVSVIYLNCGP